VVTQGQVGIVTEYLASYRSWRPAAGLRKINAEGERQFIFNDDGEKVFGLWILPEEDRCDSPVIVDPARK